MDTAIAAAHVLAAAVWVGGTVALVFIAVPVARRLTGEARAAALREMGRRWRPIGWGAMAVLVATGFSNAASEGVFDGTADGEFIAVFSAKMALFAALLVVAALHDFVLGPGLARQIREGRPQTLRPKLVFVGWASFALTIAVPVLGVVLAHLG